MENPVILLQELLRCPSITPKEGGALDALEKMAKNLGFTVQRLTFKDENTPDVDNLYARLGEGSPHLMFAGHSDVVPVGAEDEWLQPPFAGNIVEDVLYGRGAVDMKGGIAAFLAAVARFLQEGDLKGSISLVITGDEEGPAINGTVKLLKWAFEQGERWDAALVGEPTNPDLLGQMIKIGRRGSLSGVLTVTGEAGHVAYPHLADNPLPSLLTLLHYLDDSPLDQGSDNFQPSNLELTSIDTGNGATNVIPAKVVARFNIRFNDHWNHETLKTEIMDRLERGAHQAKANRGGRSIHYQLAWLANPADVFITRHEKLISSLSHAIIEEVGRTPSLSTSGGTSDARFIKDYCPVVEFGLVGQLMHKVNEAVPLTDLEQLTRIYQRFISRFFA